MDYLLLFMRFYNIEVSGIKNIVFNKKRMWEKQVDNSWFESNRGLACSHEEMMWIVNRLKYDRKSRMWVHGDALNIEQINPKGGKPPK
jgi:hypothetical protein